MRSLRLSVAVLLACSCAVLLAQNSNQDPYRAAQLVARWRIIVNQKFEESRASSSEAIDGWLDEFWSVGAVRAVRDRASEQQLKTADAGMERFATAIVHSGARQPDGSVMLSESSVVAAQKSTCPLYPFC